MMRMIEYEIKLYKDYKFEEKLDFIYRINVTWTPLLNRTPPIENYNRTPVKNRDLG